MPPHLVDDHILAHELQEASHVEGWVRGRDELLLPLVDPHLDPVFGLLLQIVVLEVVDDSDVVDESPVLTYVLVASTILLKFKILDHPPRYTQSYFGENLPAVELAPPMVVRRLIRPSLSSKSWADIISERFFLSEPRYFSMPGLSNIDGS